jgi:hypothetical protein
MTWLVLIRGIMRDSETVLHEPIDWVPHAVWLERALRVDVTREGGYAEDHVRTFENPHVDGDPIEHCFNRIRRFQDLSLLRPPSEPPPSVRPPCRCHQLAPLNVVSARVASGVRSLV